MAMPETKYAVHEIDECMHLFEDTDPVRAHLFRLAKGDILTHNRWINSKARIMERLLRDEIPFQEEELDHEINLVNAFLEQVCRIAIAPMEKSDIHDVKVLSSLLPGTAETMFNNEAMKGWEAGKSDLGLSGSQFVPEELKIRIGDAGMENEDQAQAITMMPQDHKRPSGGANAQTRYGAQSSSEQVRVIREGMDVKAELQKNQNSLPMIAQKRKQTAVDDILYATLTCQLTVDDQKYGGEMTAQGCKLDTTFRIENPFRDPKAVIRIQCYGKNGDLLRKALVEFDLGSDVAHGLLPQTKFIHIDTCETPSTHEPRALDYLATYRIEYHDVSVSGVGNLYESGIPKEFRPTFEILEQITKPKLDHPAVLEFNLAAFADRGRRSLQTLHDAMFKSFPLNYYPYLPDLDLKFDGRLAHLVSRAATFTASRGIITPFAARNSFRSANGALIVQNHCTNNEYLYVEARKAQLESAIHQVAFQIVDETHGKLYLRADTDYLRISAEDRRFDSDVRGIFASPMSTEELLVTAKIRGKQRTFRGALIQNPDHRIDATYQIHLQAVPDDFNTFAQVPRAPLFWRAAKATISTNRQTVSKQLDANLCFWQYDEYSNISRVALGQQLGKAPKINPANDIGVTREAGMKIIGDMHDMFPWNDEQKAIISSAFAVPGAVGCISAAGGSGKTECDAALAVIYLQAGFHVMAMAQTNSATDTLHAKISKMCKVAQLAAPPRMYGIDKETNWLMSDGKHPIKGRNTRSNQVVKAMDNDHDQEVAALDNVKEKQHQRRFMSPEDSVAEALRSEYILPKKPLMVPAKTKQSEHEDSEVIYYGPDSKAYKKEANKSMNVEMIDGIAEYHRLQQLRVNGKTLSDRDAMTLRYYCIRLLRSFVAIKPCIVTTIQNSWNIVLRNAFATDTKGIVFIIDEVSCVAEIEINTALTKLMPLPRLRNEFGSQQPIKAVWMSADPLQLSKFTLNRTHNEFYAQGTLDYVSRLSAAGHKIFKLRTQYRFHSTLLELLINPQIYRNTLIAGNGTQASLDDRKFDSKQFEYLYKYHYPTYLDLSKRQLSAEEKDELEKDLHYRFIHVNPSEAFFTNTGSQLNPANIAVYRDFVVEAFLELKLFNPTDFVFLSPYFAQIQACELEMVKILRDWNSQHPNDQKTNMDLPDMIVADSAQSREFKYVWYDSVVTDSQGMLADDRRGHSHLTRAKDSLWIVGSEDFWVLENEAELTKQDRHGREIPIHNFITRAITVCRHKYLLTVKKPSKFTTPHHLLKLKSFRRP